LSLEDIFLVSFGAALGANTRFLIYKKFEKLNISKYYNILLINTFASFLLGLMISILSKNSHYDFSYKIILFFSIGFLGSLSTFSSFIYDLFDSFLKLKFFSALKLFFLSLSLGIISLAFGVLIGNQ